MFPLTKRLVQVFALKNAAETVTAKCYFIVLSQVNEYRLTVNLFY